MPRAMPCFAINFSITGDVNRNARASAPNNAIGPVSNSRLFSLPLRDDHRDVGSFIDCGLFPLRSGSETAVAWRARDAPSGANCPPSSWIFCRKSFSFRRGVGM